VTKAPPASGYDWNGAYLGGHVGFSRGRTGATIVGPDTSQQTTSLGGLYAGVQGGYNYVLPSGVLLGLEADLSFPNYLARDDVAFWQDQAGGVALREKVDFLGSLRARFGALIDPAWLVYGTGGVAWSHGRFLQGDATDDDISQKILRWRLGWTIGLGSEVALAPNWSARLEYLYTQFGASDVLFDSSDRYSSHYDLHTVRLGLNRKLGAGAPLDAPVAASRRFPFEWEIHGQATYIQQGYPRFRAPYSGENSFTPWAQTRETLSVSAFIGIKVWQGGEFYFNPELLQGFGLHATSGAAGFPNGEAQKSDFPYPHYNTSRLFLRQTFGLGGEQEQLESGYGQMAAKVDVSRITVQAGKFAVKDVFDNNAYASDPRVHFMNWSIWAAGAFDYPADRVGLTYGVTAELNQKHWALRGGYFLVGNMPNANQFDMNIGRRGGYMAELETRYSIGGQPGKLRLAGWFTETYSGSFRGAVDLVNFNPGLDATDAIVQTREGRPKYGYIVNLEQAVTDDLGVFGRWSWNSGQNEISAFTDIDASASGGAVLKGTSWGRPDDKIGIGGAVNMISRAHRDYLAAGGISVLVGDGRLNYRPEKVLEAYYAWAVYKNTTLTLDYQFLADPAYNADRGPVSIFAARVHTEF
jgi:high affinity Mn2+ porin